MSYSRSKTRKFLSNYFNDNALTNLCFDYFPLVESNFTLGMVKDQKIRELIVYCENQNKTDDLLAALERERPDLFVRELSLKPEIRQLSHRSFEIKRNLKQIFLSHSSDDKEIARQIALALSKRGWDVWIAPDSIRPGEKWVEAIERGLQESGVFLLLMTSSAVKSRWVRSEADIAIQMEHEEKIHLVTLQVEPCELPPFWNGYQRLEFPIFTPEGFDNLASLLETKSRYQETSDRGNKIEAIESSSNRFPQFEEDIVDVEISEDFDISSFIANLDRELTETKLEPQVIVVDNSSSDDSKNVSQSELIINTEGPSPLNSQKEVGRDVQISEDKNVASNGNSAGFGFIVFLGLLAWLIWVVPNANESTEPTTTDEAPRLAEPEPESVSEAPVRSTRLVPTLEVNSTLIPDRVVRGGTKAFVNAAFEDLISTEINIQNNLTYYFIEDQNAFNFLVENVLQGEEFYEVYPFGTYKDINPVLYYQESTVGYHGQLAGILLSRLVNSEVVYTGIFLLSDIKKACISLKSSLNPSLESEYVVEYREVDDRFFVELYNLEAAAKDYAVACWIERHDSNSLVLQPKVD